jgi:hypothetical protein
MYVEAQPLRSILEEKMYLWKATEYGQWSTASTEWR